jgi:hypothetical protein
MAAHRAANDTANNLRNYITPRDAYEESSRLRDARALAITKGAKSTGNSHDADTTQELLGHFSARSTHALVSKRSPRGSPAAPSRQATQQAMIALIAPSALGRSLPVTHEPFRLVAS